MPGSGGYIHSPTCQEGSPDNRNITLKRLAHKKPAESMLEVFFFDSEMTNPIS